jgi:signal transduction histidine kinase
VERELHWKSLINYLEKANMMNIFSFSSVLVIFTTSLIGIFFLIKGKGEGTKYIYGIFCIDVTIWAIGAYIFSNASSKEIAFLGWQIAHIGMIFTPPLFFHFVCKFTKVSRRFLIFFSYCLGIIFTGFLFLRRDLFLGDLKFLFGQFYWLGWNPQKNIIYLVYYLLFYQFLLLYAFILLVIFYFNTKGLMRNKVKYIIVAALIGWFGPHGMFLLVFGINFYPYSNFLVAVYPLIIAYAIIRYRLMDISLAITRTGIFIAIYSLILGSPLLVIYYLQNQLVYILGVSWWIVPFLCSTALATLGPFLYIYFEKKAEDRLLREQRNYQNILRGASAGMIRIRKLDLLLKLIVYVVAKIVRLEHASVYLLDSKNQQFLIRASRMSNGIVVKNLTIDPDSALIKKLITDKDSIISEEVAMRLKDDANNEFLAKLMDQLISLNAALVVPSFIENRLIGILVLGEKRSKRLYSEDDLAVFSVLANQAALAIENAQFYDEIKRTQESLFQAEKLATIGTMADGLSHQINNRFHALSLISGDSLDVIKTYDFSQCSEPTKQIFNDLKNSLERIQANVLQGGEVVKGLLKYSRPGQGGFEKIDLRDVLKGAVEMVGYKIKLKEIDLVMNIPPESSHFHGNIIQLQEVFFNLIDNAYDAIKERQMMMKEDGYKGKIEISTMADGTSLHINVKDNGIGVDQEDKKKLFTPFFTTKATAKKGTGLGLYVIEKIIASHNGQIRMDSVYQSGTCFTISLPITEKIDNGR